MLDLMKRLRSALGVPDQTKALREALQPLLERGGLPDVRASLPSQTVRYRGTHGSPENQVAHNRALAEGLPCGVC